MKIGFEIVSNTWKTLRIGAGWSVNSKNKAVLIYVALVIVDLNWYVCKK